LEKTHNIGGGKEIFVEEEIFVSSLPDFMGEGREDIVLIRGGGE